MKYLPIAICALLTACAGPAKLPERVLVPISTPCIAVPIPAPAFVSDPDLAKLPDYEFVLTLSKDRLERRDYISLLEAQAQGCM